MNCSFCREIFSFLGIKTRDSKKIARFEHGLRNVVSKLEALGFDSIVSSRRRNAMASEKTMSVKPFYMILALIAGLLAWTIFVILQTSEDTIQQQVVLAADDAEIELNFVQTNQISRSLQIGRREEQIFIQSEAQIHSICWGYDFESAECVPIVTPDELVKLFRDRGFSVFGHIMLFLNLLEDWKPTRGETSDEELLQTKTREEIILGAGQLFYDFFSIEQRRQAPLSDPPRLHPTDADRALSF